MKNLSASTSVLEKNYTLEFQSCIKWRLEPEAFILVNNKQLLYKPRNLTYNLGFFILAQDGSAAVCVPEELHPTMATLDQAYMYLVVATITFLVLSIAVHIWVVREIRGHVVQPIIFHKGCLVIYYILLCIFNGKLCRDSDILPKIVMVAGFYFARAAYCWLNVISFDMWRAFHPQRILQIPRSLSQTSPLRHFALQALFAFGVPALVIGTCILLHFLQEPDLNPWKYIGPMYGNQAQFLFMISAASTSVLANAVFSISIIRNIHHIRRSNTAYVNLTSNRQEIFVIYMKLVMVSGFLYFLHIGQVVAMNYYPYTAYWLYFDWPANAQGLWLFLIYCCNPSILRASKKKLLTRRSTWFTKLSRSG